MSISPTGKRLCSTPPLLRPYQMKTAPSAYQAMQSDGLALRAPEMRVLSPDRPRSGAYSGLESSSRRLLRPETERENA